MGRPKLPETKARSIFISIRLSKKENEKVRKAFHKSGMKKSEWLRAAILGAAKYT
jgi:hypothetical protein